MQYLSFKKCALTASLFVCACTTTPPPQQVCSADWIDTRVDRAMNEFERDVRPMLRTFRRASDRLEGSGGEIDPFMMLQLMNAARSFVDRLETSQALEDLQRVSQQCDDPDLMIEAVTGLLEKRGAPPQVLRIMREMNELQRTDGQS